MSKTEYCYRCGGVGKFVTGNPAALVVCPVCKGKEAPARVDYGVTSPKVKDAMEQHEHVMHIENVRDDAWDRLMDLVKGLDVNEATEYLSLTGGITGEEGHESS